VKTKMSVGIRYIELNPVRANMVSHPAEYPWSGFKVNGQGARSSLISPHPGYLDLGTDELVRLSAYRSLFKTCLDYTDVHAICEATQFCTPLSNDRFKQQIERALGRSTGYAKRGRPRVNEEYAIYIE
jgi:putative transposase